MSGAEPPSAGRRAGRVEISGLGRFPAAADPDLPEWVRGVVSDLAPDAGSFALRFVGDRTMRRWNRDYRGMDRTTDVLSFPGEATPEGPHLGDVAISVPEARRQAEERGESLARELRVLALHGLLHCLGYDHETDQGEMVRLERRLHRRYLTDV